PGIPHYDLFIEAILLKILTHLEEANFVSIAICVSVCPQLIMCTTAKDYLLQRRPRKLHQPAVIEYKPVFMLIRPALRLRPKYEPAEEIWRIKIEPEKWYLL